MLGYYSPGDELLSITLIGFYLLPRAGQLPFNSSWTETSEQLYGSSVVNTNTTLCSGKGKIPQKHGCVNSSRMLMLLITYFLVTQFITWLEQRKCKVPHELHCWVVFSVMREMH